MQLERRAFSLSPHCHHRHMLRATFTTELGAVSLWHETNPDGAISQDSYLVDEREGYLRLAVCDGVTPIAQEPYRLGLDRGRFAAEVAKTALFSDHSIEDAIDIAQTEIFAETDDSDRPKTALVAADITREGSRVVIAGDCEAWVRTHGRWQLLDCGDILQDTARSAYQELVSRGVMMDPSEFRRVAAELLDDEQCWRRTGLGRFREIKPKTFAVSDNEGLVLASDGALLNPERIERLDEWIRELREWESAGQNTERFKRHDDVTVLAFTPLVRDCTATA